MLRILFWNLHRRDLSTPLCKIVTETSSDIVIVLENVAGANSTLASLKSSVSSEFALPGPFSRDRFHLFSRRLDLDLSEVHSGYRTSVRSLILNGRRIFLALVHGVDMRNHDEHARHENALTMAAEIRLAREGHGGPPVIVIGDFNMNPYDRGMWSPRAFNAVMTRRCALRKSRQHHDETFEFYFNPMWSLLGDRTGLPPGTVYDTSLQGPYGWNLVDQVLVHHSLVNDFESVRIVHEVQGLSLARASGRPDDKRASDHFPILVELRGA